MILVILTLFSSAGISLTSSLHRRGHNHVPLINCPSCQHHICDVSNTIQCEVCHIKLQHQGQPPIDTQCVQVGHCHSDNHHQFCCDTEACVASFFRDFHTTNTTTHHITNTDSMAHCPSCHGGDCDFVNRDTCHVCKFDLHPGQLPHVHCLNENEHCTDNHNTLCCSDESCIARAFGSLYPGASSIHPTMSKEIHVTDPNVYCPRCHEGLCDFVNRDTCNVCKFDLHTGQLPHVHCLKGNEHCNDNQKTLCCKEESCIANAFGAYYPRTLSTNPTTASNKTTSTHHVVNHQRMYVSCPICIHGVCDPSRSHSFCTGCVYHQDHKTTTCIKLGHEQECEDTDKQICCLTDECITKWFGVVVNTIDQGSSSLHNFIFCPKCDHNGQCHYSLCDKCEYNTEHNPPQLKCIQQGHHCHEDDAHHSCCQDIKCIEQAFGSSSWMISTSLPSSHQVPTLPTAGTSTTAIKVPTLPTKGTSTTSVQTTRELDMVECPICRNGQCDFKNNTKCVVCEISYDSKNASIMPMTHCDITDNCADGADLICCRTVQCIIGAYEQYFQTFRSSTTLPTTKGFPDHTKVNTSNPITLKHTSVATPITISNVSTSPSYTTTTTTTPSSTSAYSPSSLRANTSEATTPLTPKETTESVSSATIVSSSFDPLSNCSDSITNCDTLKGYGVCHAIPEQRDKYDIAFLQCRSTCNLCTDEYRPLVTTTPRPAIHCQVCGDYNNDIPCDTRSIYIGPTVSCSGNNNYCMTDIVHSHSNTKVFKRCVNETVCRNQWLSQTSDQDHCTNYGHVPVSGDYTCHFCCTSNQCNQGLLPESSTLYTKS